MSLRIELRSTAPEARPRTIAFEGDAVPAYDGESIAAALAAAGRLGLRRSEDGTPRGMFCGMGVCAECLVPIGDGPRVRACIAPVSAAATPPGADEMLRPDVLVVGGGPAGLAAARAAALAGAQVLLLDERPHPGGQYFKQVATSRAGPFEGDAQSRRGGELIAEVAALGVTLRPDATVWGAFRPRQIAAVIGGASCLVEPRQVVLATGAYERGVPMPGWTLPGFMTTGAAQTLVRSYRVLPGRRVLVAGNGPLNLQLAAELIAAGTEVVAVVEAAPNPFRSAPGDLAGLLRAPDLARDGLAYLLALRRAGVRIFYGAAVVAAEGGERVGRAVIAPIDSTGRPAEQGRVTLDVDTVCIGYGFLPANDLARLLGCAHRWDPSRRTFATVRDDDMRSSVEGVLVAGDCGGMVGARASIEQGFIAGCTAAETLGHPLRPELEREREMSRRRLRRHLAFQASLWRIFQAPVIERQLAHPSTEVCRCEHVTLQRLEAEIAGGVSDVGTLKRHTRAGMGRCQGRYCGAVLAGMLAEATEGPSEAEVFAPRPPVRPVPIGAIARYRPDQPPS